MKKNIILFIFITSTISLFSLTNENYWKNINEVSNKENNEKKDVKYQLIMKWNNDYQKFDFLLNDLSSTVLRIKKIVPFNNEKKIFYDRDYFDSDINKFTKNHWYMYWNKFLPNEYHSNFSKVDYMVKYLRDEARKNKWSKKTLMLNVISHVQAIIYQQPRRYINDWRYGAFYFDYFTPNEIALYEKGDCDSKSIFMVILLNRLGFESICFISREYLHAMVGINTKASGRFLVFNNKKYYFLESTFPDWEIGVIPNGCDNINCWDILRLE